MEIEHLREFVVFAETMNYSIAAKKLFIAQPTLSQHIRKIEKELGFELVARGGTPELTDEGIEFHVRIQRLLHDYDGIVASCSKPTSQASVRILDFPDFPDIPISEALSADTACKIERVSDYEALQRFTEFELLDDGVVDIAFAFSADESTPALPSGANPLDYRFASLAPVRLLFCMPADHPLASFSSIGDAPAERWALVEDGSPLLASSAQAIYDALSANGRNFYSIKARGASVFQSLKFGTDYMCVLFEKARQSAEPIANEHGFVIKQFDDIPGTIHCFAVCRSDNTNPNVIKIMDDIAPSPSAER